MINTQKLMEERKMPSGSQDIQQAMIEACETGNIPRLLQLLQTCNLTGHSIPIAEDEPKKQQPLSSDSAPTWKLIAAAVRHAQFSVLSFLLQRDPTVNIHYAGILNAALLNPNLEIFQLLRAHSPAIVNFEFDSLNTSLLMESCRGGNPLLPTYLLDHGADANEGGFPGAGPLFYAVRFDQPVEVVKKMLDQGAVVTKIVLKEATRKQGTPVSDLLLLERGGLKGV